jgi:signal transduction histidine kinase
VEIINEAAGRLLKVKNLKHISALSALSSELPDVLTNLKPGGHRVLKLTVDNEIVRLTIRIAEYRIGSRKIRLASVQNIRNELEDEELDAWQKLIRVLTHEIMNSVTPVNSLTNTIIRLFERQGQPRKVAELVDTDLLNALEALHSIEKRNKGLIGFVQSYRSLTQIQKPRFTRIDVTELLKNISRLVAEEMGSAGISFSWTVHPEPLIIEADEKLVEQVLLNLLNNARHALEEIPGPAIAVRAWADRTSVCIEVKDNGCGIPDEIAGSIFIPFFTTRATGSGIGLSLSRQIMRLHGGNVAMKSQPGVETVFTLVFPM